MNVPPSLLSPEIAPLWDRVRDRLERRGAERRGRVRIPELSSQGRLALQALLGHRLRTTADLRVLEDALIRLGVGTNLPSALAALGHGVSGDRAVLRAERAERLRARTAARAEVDTWAEPWAPAWFDTVIRTGLLHGLDAEHARDLLGQIRRVLDSLDQSPVTPVSRVDLAARILGSAHALDSGTRLEAAITHALRLRLGPAGGRELWEQVGVHLDLTSAPVLTFGLPVLDDGGLAAVTAAASRAGIPLHLTRFALERHPIAVPPGAAILVVENPRLVEAAAQARIPTPVLSTNGQPSTTVLLLLDQLRLAGAELRYHGDFDSAGLAICERMTHLGLRPWRMNAADYRAALRAADAEHTHLPRDPRAPGPTSWDPALRDLFERERRIVHQERLLPGLLEPQV